MLTIHTTEIPERGLELTESLPKEWLNASLGEDRTQSIRAAAPAELALTLRKMNRRISIKGVLSLELAFQCSRCARPGAMRLDIKLKETFLPLDKFQEPKGRNVDLDARDFKFAFYENDTLDLGAYLAESLLLEIPMFPRCADEDACAAEPVEHREDWEVDERELRRNPAWQDQLEWVKETIELDDDE